MGKRGPKPTPTALKIAKGETRPSRVNYEEPVPLQEPPVMPKDMSQRAKAVWRHVLKQMPDGVIVGADAHILRLYCEAVADYLDHRELSTSPLRQNSRGDIVVHPIQRVIRADRDAIRALAGDLGLTPAARVSLRMDAAQGADVLDGLGPMLSVVGE